MIKIIKIIIKIIIREAVQPAKDGANSYKWKGTDSGRKTKEKNRVLRSGKPFRQTLSMKWQPSSKRQPACESRRASVVMITYREGFALFFLNACSGVVRTIVGLFYRTTVRCRDDTTVVGVDMIAWILILDRMFTVSPKGDGTLEREICTGARIVQRAKGRGGGSADSRASTQPN